MLAAFIVILLRILASEFGVIQPPATLPAYVSTYNITQFSIAADAGSIGLLVHSLGRGTMFADVAIGNTLRVTFDDGTTRRFVVTELYRARAIEAMNPYSDFIVDGTQVTSTQLFRLMYRPNMLTLQTCEGAAGRLFVIAQPIEE